MMQKRLLALSLAGAVVTAMAACGTPASAASGTAASTSTSSSTQVSADSGKLNPAGTYPIAKEKTKLSVLMVADPLIEDYETNQWTKIIEEKCNVELSFEFLPADKPGDKLAIMINGGEKLPDIINFELDVTAVQKYADAGAIIPVDEYYDAGLAPNVEKAIDRNPSANIMANVVVGMLRFRLSSHF